MVKITTLAWSVTRIGTALNLKVEDLRPRGAWWQLRLHGKN
jgi:hypothetical protein